MTDGKGAAVLRRRTDATYAVAPRIERVVFICGLHRSGTTLFEQHIQARFRVSVLRAQVPENEGQHLQTAYPAANRLGGAGRFAFSPQASPPPPDAAEAQRLRRRIVADWLPFVVGDSPVLLEKSPPNLTRIAWLRAVFPGSSFLVCVRDPRVVSAATLKWSKTSMAELMRHWEVAHAIALRDMGEDCRLLCYEDFCQDPDGTLERAGIPDLLDRRAVPRDTDERFRTLRNRNGAYLAQLPPTGYGEGVWTRFGYRLP